MFALYTASSKHNVTSLYGNELIKVNWLYQYDSWFVEKVLILVCRNRLNLRKNILLSVWRRKAHHKLFRHKTLVNIEGYTTAIKINERFYCWLHCFYSPTLLIITLEFYNNVTYVLMDCGILSVIYNVVLCYGCKRRPFYLAKLY